MGRTKSKKGKASPPDTDRITSLPEHIREHILTFLPVQEAAKASFLSTRWRNIWTRIPSLVFDETFYPIMVLHEDDNDDDNLNRLMFKLCTVLLLHRGPLREFTLSLPILRSHPDLVDRILMFLQRHHTIDSLTFTVGERHMKSREPLEEENEDYKLPKRMFSPSSSWQLKTLRLSCCEIESSSSPDSFFGGRDFGLLNVLELRNVVFKESHPSTPWSFRCPLLSSLTMVDCGGFFEEPDIVIEAPKLDRLELDGKFSSVHLKQAPVLKTAILHKQSFLAGDKKEDPSKLLPRLWGGLASSVESLSVSGDFYMYLAKGYKAIRSDLSLEMVRHLTLDGVCMSRRSDIGSALFLIRKSSNLQQLTITIDIKRRLLSDSITSAVLERLFSGHQPEVGKFGGMFEGINGTSKWPVVKKVAVKSLHGTKHEMAFVRWLLNLSSALEKMEVQVSEEVSAADKITVLAELNEFERPSTTAQVIIID